MPLFIKICGLRTPEIVDTCVALGVDAVGFVFAPKSPRFLEPATARELVERVPESVESVGVFLDAPVETIVRQTSEAGIHTAQLHGDYTPRDTAALHEAGLRVIHARAVSAFLRGAPHTGRVLIDGDDPGSGAEFAAALLAGRALPDGWILAGGLAPQNVARRVHELAPSGVDVSSGVESSRGVKSAQLIEDFVRAARR